MRKNTKGSTLVAAVIVIMVIMVVLSGALTISSSYSKRSISENTRKQVYLSAKSGANTVAQLIVNGNSDFIPTTIGEEKEFTLELESDMMDKKGKVKKIDDKTLKITVEATFDEDMKYKYQVIMKYSNKKWIVYSNCEAKDGDALC